MILIVHGFPSDIIALQVITVLFSGVDDEVNDKNLPAYSLQEITLLKNNESPW